MILILDGVLAMNQMRSFDKNITYSTDSFVSGYMDKKGEGWFKKLEYHKNYAMCSSILDIIGKHFDITDMKGYDYWTHTNTRPGQWHYDKDEIAYVTKGISRFPICSSVYYMKADCTGGHLKFKNGVDITPVENRLVIFSPKLYHGVEQFTGTRVSVNINPWDTKLYNDTNI